MGAGAADLFPDQVADQKEDVIFHSRAGGPMSSGPWGGGGGASLTRYWGGGMGLTCEPGGVRIPGAQAVSECRRSGELEHTICSQAQL